MDPIAEMASPGIPALAEREARGFDQFVSALDDEGWGRTVPACAPWRVRDLIAHVAGVAEMYGGSIRASLAGRPGPLWDDLAAARRERAARADWGREQLLDVARQHLAEMRATLERLTPADYPIPAWHPRGMWSIGRLQVAWFWEVGIHYRDLRSAFDPNAGFDADLVPTYVEYLTRALPRYLGSQSDASLTATYRFALPDLGRSIGVRLERGSHEVVPNLDGGADVTFETEGSTLVLLVLSRISPEAATAQGRLTVAGDPALADRFWGQLARI